MSGQLPSLPQTLPPSIYAQASGGAGGRALQCVATHGTRTRGSTSPSQLLSFPASSATTHPTVSPLVAQGTGQVNIPRQTTGQAAPLYQPPISRTAVAANMTGTALGSMAFSATKHWDVSPAEKAKFDQFFDNLDAHKRRFIEGDVAVPFMLQSKLSEDVLAQIW